MNTRVVLLEKQDIVREGVRSLLSAWGDQWQIDETAEFKDALALARRDPPAAIVYDPAAPGFDALDVTAALRRAAPASRIVALYGALPPAQARAVLDAGADAIVPKDRACAELLSALQPSPRRPARGRTRRAALAHPPPLVLSGRERQVLALIADGLMSKEIASRLGISTRTVEVHRRHIVAKLKVDSVAGLTKIAIRHGLTSL
ncbi:MAG TPA: response regulator transcription factor [Candidatus Brocadiia bacterium]|nr:response regulator transcription factor [Candidatus Brocadiia bacterium]